MHHNIHEKIIPLVRERGRIMLDRWDELKIATEKGVGNYATDVDVENEEFFKKELRALIPGSGFIGEESGKSDVDGAEYCWIVDPVDGTYNYFNQLPLFNISIALQKGDEIVFGLVYAPVSHELFYAEKGMGAYLIRTLYDENYIEEKTVKLSVSKTPDVEDSYMYIDFPYNKICREEGTCSTLSKFFHAVHRVRSFGAAALAICYMARGAYDGYINLKSAKLHDIAAGLLIVEEAGGMVTDFKGNPYKLGVIDCIATNGRIHHDLIKRIT